MSTQKNLEGAFAGESQANRKYLAYAKKAEIEGFPQIAKLFRAAAAAETVHANAHLRAMGGIKSTSENLQDAIEGEGYEYRSMYPPFLQEANNDGNKQAEVSFKNALAVEEIHHNLYSKAYQSIELGDDLSDRKIYVCEVCGNTVYNNPQDPCAICGAPREKFTEID